MPDKTLDAKIALVTRASRGIGRAIALRLAASGAAVVVNYLGRAAQADEVVSEIKNAGGRAVAVQADVSKVEAIGKLFDETFRHFGKLDILVNNAGIILYKPLIEVTEDEFDRLMAINVKGTFFACQQAARRMPDGGRIINFSSTLTALMLPTYSAYVASKGAIEQITRVLARELGHRQITVNTVSPGPTDTELFSEGKTEQQKQAMAKSAALGRLGMPDDIAGAVAFLASEEARWITGQNIRVNGGTI